MKQSCLVLPIAVLLVGVLGALFPESSEADPSRPNVVLVITDDQGYGDIAAHGNTMIRTPNLDRLHGQSIRLTDFHVDPTCSPTRSALMTGRYSTRTGVWHTIQGRSLMSPTELTLGEVFQANGYQTAMFGKWHLGDNAPLRPQDQGFETTIHHGGGGVGQTPDWWGNDYFDDIYVHEDGRAEQFHDYCTDVWFQQTIKYVDQARKSDRPFFCYLATNAPHGPYYVSREEKQPYLDAGVPEPMASFYGMITNIDRNLGFLMDRLEDWHLAENTILIFMTDNGTAAGVARRRPQAQWQGFNAGMRGQKGSEYDGGHRVPFFIRWPNGKLTGGRDVKTLSAHIDVLPTLVDLCGLTKPDGPPLDGMSLVPALSKPDVEFPSRTLFVHSQRIETPEKWRLSSVLTDRWRLVNGKELFDIRADPGQQSNVASANGEVVQRLRAAYDEWWQSLVPVFDEHVRIDLGNPAEPISHLTCHDWLVESNDAPLVPWNQQQVAQDLERNGVWAVNVVQPGTYELTLRMRPGGVISNLPQGTARMRIGDQQTSTPIQPGDFKAVLKAELPAGPAMLQTWLEADSGESRGAYFVDVRLLETE
ncbi:MAG: arylsulfatase [Planctomycetaceae bacterium]|nr:arylsulfatase [Planctomycetaceae bacterium]